MQPEIRESKQGYPTAEAVSNVRGWVGWLWVRTRGRTERGADCKSTNTCNRHIRYIMTPAKSLCARFKNVVHVLELWQKNSQQTPGDGEGQESLACCSRRAKIPTRLSN